MLASGKSDCSDLFKRVVTWSGGVMRWRKRGGGLASLWFRSGSPCSDLFVVVEGRCTVSLRWAEDGSSLVATNVGNRRWRWMAYLHSESYSMAMESSTVRNGSMGPQNI
ncbi:hypothetical protein ACLB2K_063788 [Fragaria x ananassa]